MWTVYIHTFPNGKKYVGMCKGSPKRRWGTGGSKYKEQPVMYAAIQKYGWDNVAHEIAASNLTQEEALRMEESLIEQYKTFPPSLGFGYNCTTGGESRLPTEKERQEKSAFFKEWWADPNNRKRLVEKRTGMKRDYSLERRKQIGERLSEYNRGKHLSEEHKKKIADSTKGRKPWNTGLKMSEEYRKKLSDSHKALGRKMPEELAEILIELSKKPVLCVETGIIYESRRSAANATGAQEAKISAVIKGKRKTAGGYHWEQVEKEVPPRKEKACQT